MKKKKLKKILARKQLTLIEKFKRIRDLEDIQKSNIQTILEYSKDTEELEDMYLSQIKRNKKEHDFQIFKLNLGIKHDEERYEEIIKDQKQEIEDLNELMKIYEIASYDEMITRTANGES